MSATPARPAEQPANLAALHRELADLATRARPADRTPQERLEQAQGTVLVIRGK